MRSGVVLVVVLGACPGPAAREAPPLADPIAVTDRDLRSDMKAELQDEVLGSYERDEPPEIESTMIPPQVGPARIGVGPGDVLIGPELERAPSRWPLDVSSSTPAQARSKRLEIHLAQDGTAGWVFDEISWRIGMCGRTAVIPLRMTALFARDGDRWIPVFEHLSFGRIPMQARDGSLRGRTVRDARIDADLHDELSRVLAPVLVRNATGAAGKIVTGPEAMLLGAEQADEWHGPDVLNAQLVAASLRAEDRRVGIVGRRANSATIAYWVGNFVADLPARPGFAAGRVRFRGTFVFEKRLVDKIEIKDDKPSQPMAPKTCASEGAECKWMLVQGHVSQPIDDGPDQDPDKREYVDLAGLVFGTALVSAKPVEVTCDDGSRRPGSPSRPPAAK